MLDIVDFNYILVIDWLSLYYVVLDYFSKTVALGFPNISHILWQGSISQILIVIISYIQAKRLVLRRFLAYLAYD